MHEGSLAPTNPIIEGDAERVLRRYPRLCAHIICDSLGYAQPLVAARVLKDAINGHENNCEWIDACYQGDPRKPVRAAIAGRHRHAGFMADYRQALLCIIKQLMGTWPRDRFAAWF